MAKVVDTVNDTHLNGDQAPVDELASSEVSSMVPSTSKEDDVKPTTGSEESNTDEKQSLKRRASAAFIDEPSEEFKGFGNGTRLDEPAANYSQILERMESEVTSAAEDFTPTRIVNARATIRLNKRIKLETDGSRPSSPLSLKSDGDGISSSTDVNSTTSSPTNRNRRTTIELSSPLLRVPLEKGWKRELVYRAALDSHSRRNADIYYYTPMGKKLRSTREIAENLSGTGLTLENFSFFKEPLGLDDPEKEIIRDAKMMRRNESPIASPIHTTVVEGKRMPKPKAPKGVSPEPLSAKLTPGKIKVKSFGSRLSAITAEKSPSTKTNRKSLVSTPTTQSENNNTTWKKPRLLVAPPPPLQSRPASTPATATPMPTLKSPPGQLQPCSMMCAGGRGAVPSLVCDACLCLYHPMCVGVAPDQKPARFLCKNCRTSPPPLEPPPLTHKSGLRVSLQPPPPARSAPSPIPPEKRVLLRMKMARGGPGGQRMWSVAGNECPRPRAPSTPQGLAALNGRRFIIVQRSTLPNKAHQQK